MMQREVSGAYVVSGSSASPRDAPAPIVPPTPPSPSLTQSQSQSQSPLGVEYVPLTALLLPRGPPKPPPPAHVPPLRPLPTDSPAPSPTPAFNGPRTIWGGVLDESMLVIAPPGKKSSDSSLKTRTYYRRKEEKEELEREVKGLEVQLQHFARRQRAKRQREEMAMREQHNQAIRFAIRTQRISFANTMSHISEFLRSHDHSKYEPTICLGTDPEERHEKLLRLKPQRLEEALGFLTERQRFMNRTTEFCDMQKFVSENGDHCMVRFDIAPIRGARSVKQTFDAALKFMYNLEIAISALMGNITLRQNEDVSWNSTVAQHRLVTSIGDKLEVDTNNVTFAEYQPDSGNIWRGGTGGWGGGLAGKEVGVAACNFVSEDGLYPYNPERLRQDITFFVLVTSFPRSGDGDQRGLSGDNDSVVVVSRWTCFRIRKPEFYVSEEELERSRDSLEQVGNAMLAEPSPQGVESVPPAESLASDAAPPTGASSTVHALWDDVSGDSVIVVPPPSKAESELALKARIYYRRKEEKEKLEREVADLRAQLEDAAWRGRVKRQREEVVTHELFAQAVRGAIHSQRVTFANTMPFFSEFLRAHDHSYYEPTICLGSDPEERYAKLLRLKPQRLQMAVRFLRERQRFMSRTAEFCDLQRFVAVNGDHCLVRFDVMPIPSAQSVKQAFDAVLKFTYNLEIAISALVGNVTLRENEDVSWNSTVAQHRLVTAMSNRLEIDINNAAFAEYTPDGKSYGDDFAGTPVGVTACNYVSEDGMYPYNALRLRQDITFFVQVSSHAPPGRSNEDVVMLPRWACFRIRKPTFDVPDREMKRSRDSLEQVGNAMLSEVLDACQSPSLPSPPMETD